ncbi:hypothetical protein PAXRUDRAFT_567796 [Paxillus rubicundulus Ve08.2h10]|uniref:Uncharacterized protein n=1 Tax=Paxillus rubicundulus Ve08.2h10 TaxID=930991 RepID=A0A0D0DM21_9AGAM|nr:hypothetical protein PAXRUDRAFT_567796 [Paxillus rubicundulus Ve08.2h10]
MQRTRHMHMFRLHRATAVYDRCREPRQYPLDQWGHRAPSAANEFGTTPPQPSKRRPTGLRRGYLSNVAVKSGVRDLQPHQVSHSRSGKRLANERDIGGALPS